MQIGSEAYIVGNPFGLYGSLSAGVVSGLDRSFQHPEQRHRVQGPDPGRRRRQSRQLRRSARSTATAASSGSSPRSINPTKQDVFIGIGLAVPINVAGGGAGLPPTEPEEDTPMDRRRIGHPPVDSETAGRPRRRWSASCTR